MRHARAEQGARGTSRLGLRLGRRGDDHRRSSSTSPGRSTSRPTRSAGTPRREEVKPPPFTRTEWARIIALVVLCALNIPFWGVYEQQGNSLQFWADESTNRHVLSWLGSDWEMPATWFQSVNPVFILLLTPFINRLWLAGHAEEEPSSVAKMAIGCFLLGPVVLRDDRRRAIVDSGQKASFGWLVGCSFLLTLGRDLPVAGGPVARDQDLPCAHRVDDDGHVVSLELLRRLPVGVSGDVSETMGSSAFFGMLAAISLATGVAMVLLLSSFKRAIGDENAVDASGSIPAPPPLA